MENWLQEAVNTADKLMSRFFVPKWLRARACLTIKMLVANIKLLEEKKTELEEWSVLHKHEIGSLNRELRDTALIAHRIDQQIDEMEKNKGQSAERRENPAAILLAPYQGNAFIAQCSRIQYRTNDSEAEVRTYRNLPVLVMSGVYGPVVVTQKALEAISRQAPELLTKAL